MQSPGFHILLLLLLWAPSCPAVEPVIRDLRVIVEARPTTFDYTWHDEVGERSGSQGCGQSWSAGLGLRCAWGAAGRPVAFLAGAEAVAEQDTFQAGSRIAAIARLEAGLAIGLGNRWSMIAAPLVGIGLARLYLADSPFGTRSLSGTTTEYGGRLGLRWAFDRSWSLGLDAGWLASSEHLAGDGTLDIRRSGPWLALGFAWILDPVAKRLE
ncbi:MAG: hypothetical protein HY859_02440 [Caulobacterales bacterium]|nr:hypothetical protein [Caulobacterales bacterium]